MYRGLDYSLAEDEARELQEDLEKVITRMTDNSGEDERDVDFDTVIEVRCKVGRRVDNMVRVTWSMMSDGRLYFLSLLDASRGGWYVSI